MIAVVMAGVAAAVAVAAADRWRRARRTRRQTIDALAAVPALAGLPATDVADVAGTAAAVAARLNLARHEVAAVATAARLHSLADLVSPGLDRGAALGRLATESGLPPCVTTVLSEALTTGSGNIGRGAAAVRVAATYERRRAEAHVTTAGALFATVRAHGTGQERRAAAALVHLVQGQPPSA